MARCQNDPTCEWLLWAASIQHVYKFWILIRMLLANGFLRSKYHDSALNGNLPGLSEEPKTTKQTHHIHIQVSVFCWNSWNNMATTLLKTTICSTGKNKALIQYLYIIVIIFGLPKFYQHFLSSQRVEHFNDAMVPLRSLPRWDYQCAALYRSPRPPITQESQSDRHLPFKKDKTMEKQKQHPGTGWFGSFTGWFGSFTGWFGSLALVDSDHSLVDSDHCLMIQFFSREKQQSFKQISVVYPSWFTRSSVA